MSNQVVFGLVIIAVSVWYLSHQAGRLDRLHHRIDVAELALHGQLVRRSGIVAELAAVPGIDPALSVLWGQAAHETLILQEVSSAVRVQVEDELTDILLMTLDEDEEVNEIRSNEYASQLLDELAQVCDRIAMSHQFHTDAVRDCLEIREQLIVRIFRLAGHAARPQTIDFDYQIPPALADSRLG
jgi:hypothetical protein